MKKIDKAKNISNEEIYNIISECNCLSDLIRKFGFSTDSWHIRNYFKERLSKSNIDISHFKKKRYHNSRRLSNRELFINEGVQRTQTVKSRIISENLIEYRCLECGIKSWNGKDISLNLDHIDGNHFNNDLSNLRFLCPNCHSQTITFAGRNRILKSTNFCPKCKSRKTHRANLCDKCKKKEQSIHIPSKELLDKLISTYTTTTISNFYKISKTTLREWRLKYGIDALRLEFDTTKQTITEFIHSLKEN